MDALLDVRVDRAASLEGDGVELEHALVDQLAQVEVLADEGALGSPRGRLVGAREDEELLDEALHVVRLVGGAVNPMHGLLGYPAVLLEYLNVGDDDREGRLELVRRVGYETPLTFPGVLHGFERPGGEEPDDHEEGGHGSGEDGDAHDQLMVEGAVSRGGVGY